MTVIVMAEAPGQTQAGYDGMLNVLAERVRQAPGFVLHSAYVVDGQWRLVEVWNSKAEADAFFAQEVARHLPPGVHPKRKVFEAHSLVVG
jgi:quinol monooxygenase YgiN